MVEIQSEQKIYRTNMDGSVVREDSYIFPTE